MFALAIVGTLFFGLRAIVFWVNRPLSATAEQSVAPWMTHRYVTHSLRVPGDLVMGTLQFPDPPPRRRMSLRDIAEYRGVTV